jgi:hypothetical protein
MDLIEAHVSEEAASHCSARIFVLYRAGLESESQGLDNLRLRIASHHQETRKYAVF